MDTYRPGNTVPRTSPAQHAVIIGGSFAGLAAAWWLVRLGYAVTVVEVAPALRKGGTPVDIRENVIDVVRRMDLLDEIVDGSLPLRPTTFLDVNGAPLTQAHPGAAEANHVDAPGWEIERDTLLDLLFDRVRHDVEFLFDTSLAAVRETPHEVVVTLSSGQQRACSLLLGCDGTHSAVRRLCFGSESSFSFFLQNYFSLTIVNQLLLPENTAQMWSVPGRTVMLNSYNGKTDIAFAFFAEHEFAYDRRDRERQKQIIRDHFPSGEWRTTDLLEEMDRCDNFYFDKLCQIRMSSWTRGRVALVGDAGYCPSPAAGMGGSMALLGAAALADALEACPDDLQAAFREYDRLLRPLVEEIQTNAVDVGMKLFLPASQEELLQRNEALHLR